MFFVCVRSSCFKKTTCKFPCCYDYKNFLSSTESLECFFLAMFFKDRCFFPNQKETRGLSEAPPTLVGTRWKPRESCGFFPKLPRAWVCWPSCSSRCFRINCMKHIGLGDPTPKSGSRCHQGNGLVGGQSPNWNTLKIPPKPPLVWFFSPQNWIKAIIVVDFYEGTMILGGLPFNSHDFARI